MNKPKEMASARFERAIKKVPLPILLTPIAIMMVVLIVPLKKHGSTGLLPKTTKSASPAPSTPVADAPAAAIECGIGHELTGRDYDIVDEGVLRIRPDEKAAPILEPGSNYDADTVAKATVLGQIPLREQCRTAGWSYITVLAPEDLRWMSGWVPSKALKAVKVGAGGRRIYGLGDIEWQMGSERHKALILKVANLIITQNKGCDAIDPQSLLVIGDRDPQFTLRCVGSAGASLISFTAADATNGRSFASSELEVAQDDGGEPITQSAAFPLCHDAIVPQLRQPRSVDFHAFDTTLNATGSRARFTITFTAKNGFGNEIDSTAECIFQGTQLLSANILE